jgi:flagellar motor switch protein FliM
VLDVFVRLAGGALTGALRIPVHMRVSDIRHSTWEEFALGVENPAHLLVLDLSPLPGRAILYFPLSLAMAMLDVRMSGPGTGKYPKRSLTEIEDSLLTPLVEAMLGELRVALAPYLEVEPRVIQKAPDIDLLQAVIPSGICVSIGFEVHLADGGVFAPSLCVQFPTVRPVVEAIEHADLAMAGSHDRGPNLGMVQRLLDVPVDLHVVFPPAHLSPVEVAGLAPGDVIPLHHDPGRPVRLVAGGMPWLSVLMTTIRRRLAAVVVEPDTYDPQEADQ